MNSGKPIHEDDEAPTNEERRDFLEKSTSALAAVGVAAASWPFIASMNPSRDVQAKAITTVDLGGLAAGQVETVEWQGKPVFIFHRTDKEIADMRAVETKIDPEPDEKRVIKPEYLVVVGVCTHLGCVPNRDGKNGWLCPCHGSLYDNSGRVTRGPAPANLAVPPYRFDGEKRIVLGKA